LTGRIPVWASPVAVCLVVRSVRPLALPPAPVVPVVPVLRPDPVAAPALVVVVVADAAVVVVAGSVVVVAGTTEVVVVAGTTVVIVVVTGTTVVVVVAGTTEVVVVAGTTEVVVLAGTTEVVELAGTTEVVELAGTTEVVELARTTEVVELARTTEVVELAGTTEVVELAGTTEVVVLAGTTEVVVVAGTAVVVVVAGTVVVVVEGGTTAHAGRLTVLESSVTAPLRASSRPSTNAPVFAVIDVKASTDPTKTEAVPSVAELPTCQKTLQALAPLTNATRLDVAVMSVEADWKMKTAPASPLASSVRAPVSPRVVPVYTPDTSVRPPRSAEMLSVVDRPAASL